MYNTGRQFTYLSIGGILGILVLLLSTKVFLLIAGLVFVIIMVVFPNFAFLAMVATIPVSLEIGGGLTICKLIVPLSFIILVANALLHCCQWPISFKSREEVFALIFFIVGFFSIFVAEDQGDALKEAIPSILYAILFFVTVAFVRKPEDFRRVVWILIIIGTFESILSVIQVRFGIFLGGEWRTSQVHLNQGLQEADLRTEGTTTNPILLAIYLQMVIPFAVGQFFLVHRKWIKIFLISATMLMLYGWYYTFARTSVISMAIMALIAVAIAQRKVRYIFVSLAAAVIVVFVLFVISPDSIMQKLNSLWGVGILNPVFDSFRFRIESILGGWNLFMHNPLFGVGYGQAISHYVPFLPSWANSPHHPLVIHNTFMVIASEQGIISLVAFIGLWVCALCSVFRAIHWPETGPFARVLLIILIGIFISIQVTPMIKEVWLVLALAIALGRMHIENENSLL